MSKLVEKRLQIGKKQQQQHNERIKYNETRKMLELAATQILYYVLGFEMHRMGRTWNLSKLTLYERVITIL